MNTPGYETTIGVLDPTTPSEPLGERKPELARNTMVGRYMVIRLLGRGGMGEVYAAHDPKLDRQVALKLLHSAHGADAAERMVREAQALARLDDPNVVQVYDAGEHEGQVFIAMQLVDGEDLSAALAKKRWSIGQIIHMFAEAGRGLAAAHAAGLVHRDFKPTNVLIDRRGRVAVTDFGLARDLASSGDGERLTGLGQIMGTPAYMSPEQHSAMPATAASDQFSFCVALWESLFDVHPFIAGDRSSIGSMSPFAIGYQIYDGAVLPPPKRHRVSRRVIDALTRGLSHDPLKRWPSMAELLAEISPAERRRKLWPVVVAAGTVAAVVGGIAVWLVIAKTSDQGPTCASQASARIDAAWSPAAAQQLHDLFVKTGRPYAEVAATHAKASLDRYTTRWQQLTTDVCTAEHATSGPAPELVVRRRGCLDERLDALRSLVSFFATDTKPEVVDHAGQLVDGLRDLGDCSDASLLAAPGTPPVALATQVTQLATELNVVEFRAVAGDFQRAKTDVTALVARADQLGWAPLRSRTQFILGKVLLAMFEPARDHLLTAAALATANHLDREAARALAIAEMASGQEHSEDALAAVAPLAKAAATRTGDRSLELMADLKYARGLVRARKWQDGAAACRAGFAAAQTLDDYMVLHEARDCMLESLLPLGRFEELQPVLDQLITDSTKELGAEHPTVADYLEVRVGTDLRRNKIADARADAQRALDIQRRVYPPKHFKIIVALHTLAGVAEAEGKPKEMIDLDEQALAMTDPTRPEQLVTISGLHVQLGMYEANRGDKDDHAKAIAHLEAAAQLIRKQSGPNSLELAILLLNYGQVKSEDNVDAAFGMLGEAKAILEHNHDKRAGAATSAMALVARRTKRYADARKYSEEALAHVDPDSPAEETALMKITLARSLVETHGDRARARKLAVEAKEMFQKLGPSQASEVKDIDTWLAKH